jgi:hypothetical protein
MFARLAGVTLDGLRPTLTPIPTCLEAYLRPMATGSPHDPTGPRSKKFEFEYAQVPRGCVESSCPLTIGQEFSTSSKCWRDS